MKLERENLLALELAMMALAEKTVKCYYTDLVWDYDVLAALNKEDRLPEKIYWSIREFGTWMWTDYTKEEVLRLVANTSSDVLFEIDLVKLSSLIGKELFSRDPGTHQVLFSRVDGEGSHWTEGQKDKYNIFTVISKKEE